MGISLERPKNWTEFSLDVCVTPIACRESKMPLAVHVPKTPAQLDQVRALMRSFIGWHKERHREDIDLVNAYFDDAAFEDELASLPGKYGPPRGQLLLATLDEAPVGCVALREIDSWSWQNEANFRVPTAPAQRHWTSLGRSNHQRGARLRLPSHATGHECTPGR